MTKNKPQSSDENLQIRMGTESDIESAFELVRELAEYEKALDEVTTTPDYYRTVYKQGLFSFIIAERKEEPVGIMIFFDAFSTWKGKMLWLEDFVVREQARRSGIGEQMFWFLVDYARKNEYALIKWEVLNWNTPAINFYKKIGARLETNWWDGKYFLK